MSCGIYRYTNLINGKRYIGQSINIEGRYKGHLYESESNKEDIQLIDKAIKKYGISNFRFEILEFCNAEELNELEKYWISYYNTNIYRGGYGYNMTDGGEGWSGHDPWNKGKIGVYTEEQLNNISIGTKNAMKRPDVRKRYLENKPDLYGKNNPFFGKHHTEETIKKIKIKNTGKKLTDKTKKLMSKQRTGRHWINNGIHELFILPDLVNDYLKNGYQYGRLQTVKQKISLAVLDAKDNHSKLK